MNLISLQITIEPSPPVPGSVREFDMESTTNGTVHKYTIPYEENDFESRFDYMVAQCKREILRKMNES